MPKGPAGEKPAGPAAFCGHSRGRKGEMQHACLASGACLSGAERLSVALAFALDGCMHSLVQKEVGRGVHHGVLYFCFAFAAHRVSDYTGPGAPLFEAAGQLLAGHAGLYSAYRAGAGCSAPDMEAHPVGGKGAAPPAARVCGRGRVCHFVCGRHQRLGHFACAERGAARRDRHGAQGVRCRPAGRAAHCPCV